MRVIAGTAKGRRLSSPAGTNTRPTSDRVREATFNALGSLGVVEGANVLDAFAGSGALGIEALSRGAVHATFIDRDPKAIEVINSNVATVGFAERSTIIKDDVTRYPANRFTAGGYPPGGDSTFDLAFFDPPYETTDDQWLVLLDRIKATTVVLETNREIELPETLELHRVGRYGYTVVMIASRRLD